MDCSPQILSAFSIIAQADHSGVDNRLFVDAILRMADNAARWRDLPEVSPRIIGDERTRGSCGRDNRMSVEAVLWILRTGSPWSDLPEVFGDWNSIFRRFSRWSHKRVWWRIFAAMPDDPDFGYRILDSTIIRAHQHASGAKKGGLRIRPIHTRLLAALAVV